MGKLRRTIAGFGKRLGLVVAAVAVLFFLDVVLLGDDEGARRVK
jgi:hypothetical protein